MSTALLWEWPMLVLYRIDKRLCALFEHLLECVDAMTRGEQLLHAVSEGLPLRPCKRISTAMSKRRCAPRRAVLRVHCSLAMS